MYNIEQITQGIAKFIDTDLICRIEDPGKRFMIGIGSSLILKRGEVLVENYKNLPFIQMLDIIDENNCINVDVLYNEAKVKIKENPLKIDVPYVGLITLKENDIERLYGFIQGN